MNKIPYIMRDESITVFVDGAPHTINNSHVNFRALRQAILDANYDAVPSLLSIEKRVENMTSGNITIVDGRLFYRGNELHGAVSAKLLALLKQGGKDASPLLNFIERIMNNPSANSVNELYTFLSYKDLPITPAGKFLAYKGVKNDFYSKSANKQTVVIEGKVNDKGEIFNGVGESIRVARNQVDDNKDNHCSFGLHAGSYDYANDWAGNNGRLLVVEIDPVDAVSVPTDCNFQKLRTCAYKVIADITASRREIPEAVYSGSDDVGNDDADYDSETEDDSLSENSIDFSDAIDEVESYVFRQQEQGLPAYAETAEAILRTVGLAHINLGEVLLRLGLTKFYVVEANLNLIVHDDNY